MYMGQYTAQIPVCLLMICCRMQFLNSLTLLATPYLENVDLHLIRKLYLIYNTLGTHNSIIVHGEWGIQKIPTIRNLTR